MQSEKYLLESESLLLKQNIYAYHRKQKKRESQTRPEGLLQTYENEMLIVCTTLKNET